MAQLNILAVEEEVIDIVKVVGMKAATAVVEQILHAQIQATASNPIHSDSHMDHAETFGLLGT